MTATANRVYDHPYAGAGSRPREPPVLAAVHANPRDAAPRLVLADALDEAGGPANEGVARWLRCDVRLTEDPFVDPADLRLRATLPRPAGVPELSVARAAAHTALSLKAFLGRIDSAVR